MLDEGTDYGVAVDGLDEKEACMKVVTAYWEAVNVKDWEAVSKLRPLATGAALGQLQAAYGTDIPATRVSVENLNHLGDPGTFVEALCLVTTPDGTERESLMNIHLTNGPDGQIGVVAGVLGAELRDAQ